MRKITILLACLLLPQWGVCHQQPRASMDEEQVIYQLLAAEMALKSQYHEVAFNVYLGMAKRLQDPELAQRALAIALTHSMLLEASSATKLWSQLAPTSLDAKAIGTILTVKSKNVAETQRYLIDLLRSHAQAEQYLKLVNHLSHQQELNNLAQALKNIEAEFKGDAHYHFLKAFILTKQQHFPLAREAIHRALAIYPDWPEGIALEMEILGQS